MKTTLFLSLMLFASACSSTPIKYFDTRWSRSVPEAAFYCQEGAHIAKRPELYAKCMRHFGAMF